MRFRFIEDRRADYPVTILCDVLGVSPAGYYAWRARPESRRSVANRALVDDIKARDDARLERAHDGHLRRVGEVADLIDADRQAAGSRGWRREMVARADQADNEPDAVASFRTRRRRVGT